MTQCVPGVGHLNQPGIKVKEALLGKVEHGLSARWIGARQ